jgi:hypothetical protein
MKALPNLIGTNGTSSSSGSTRSSHSNSSGYGEVRAAPNLHVCAHHDAAARMQDMCFGEVRAALNLLPWGYQACPTPRWTGDETDRLLTLARCLGRGHTHGLGFRHTQGLSRARAEGKGRARRPERFVALAARALAEGSRDRDGGRRRLMIGGTFYGTRRT